MQIIISFLFSVHKWECEQAAAARDVFIGSVNGGTD